MKNQTIKNIVAIAVTLSLSGCVLTDPDSRSFAVEGSYLEQETNQKQAQELDAVDADGNTPITSVEGAQFLSVAPLVAQSSDFTSGKSLSNRFEQSESLKLAAEKMPMNDFLHYVFGELLGVDYIIGDTLQKSSAPVTLNIQNEISPRRLFELTQELLVEQGVTIQERDGLYVIMNLTKKGKANAVLGYGSDKESVPAGALDVVQVVPLKYSLRSSTGKIIRELTDVKMIPDLSQGLLVVTGKRQEVVKALDMLALLDAPSNTSKHMGLIELKYISAEEFIETVNELLLNEGIVSRAGDQDKRLALTPVPQLGAVAIFAADENFVTRVRYWASKMDKPSQGADMQYFIYQPQYARAADIGESLSKLIGGKSLNVQKSEDKDSAKVEVNASASSAASNQDMKMVVDERANTLIFHTSSTEYQSMLPLISKLDVMPKQVILDMTIAEVTMTDEFRFGVEWAFSSGKFSASTEGAFGPDGGIGGGVIKWANGDDLVNAQAFESNNNVNIMSKPSILVRDGVSASINVGNDIPVVGSTTTDSTNGVTRSVEYRKTGVSVTVTPTINAQGVVIMTIEQENSNTVDGGTVTEGNPSIFERSLSTEVVADSGQTVILGGLISENVTDNGSGVPILAGLPIVGALFGTKTDTTVKTELVIMVTPRIIDRSSQWMDIKEQFRKGLDHVQIQ